MDEDTAAFLDLIFDKDDPAVAAGVLYDILAGFKDYGSGPGAADLNAGLSVLEQASLDEDETTGLLRAARAALNRCSHQLQGSNKATALFAIAFCDWHLDDAAKAEAGIREMLAVPSPRSSTLETLTNPKAVGGVVTWFKAGTAIAGVLGGIVGSVIGGALTGRRIGYSEGEEAGALQVLQTYGRAYLQRQAETRRLGVGTEVAESRVARRLRESKQKHAHTGKEGEAKMLQMQIEAAAEKPLELERKVDAHCPACGLVKRITAQPGRARVVCPGCSCYFGVDV